MRLVKLPGKIIRSIKNVARRIDQATGRGLILAYHRVADISFDPQLLAVSPRNFKEQLEVLKRICQPTNLGDCVRSRRRGRPLVAVTFDDGYADNFKTAHPLLEGADIPATFFVVSGLVGTDYHLRIS